MCMSLGAKPERVLWSDHREEAISKKPWEEWGSQTVLLPSWKTIKTMLGPRPKVGVTPGISPLPEQLFSHPSTYMGMIGKPVRTHSNQKLAVSAFDPPRGDSLLPDYCKE